MSFTNGGFQVGPFQTNFQQVGVTPPPVSLPPGMRHLGRVVLEPKFQDETILEQFDFTGGMLYTDSLVSGLVTAAVYSGNDPSPQSIVQGAATVSGTIVTQALTGGQLGCIYAITCVAVLASGENLVLKAYYAIIPDLP